jgi:hypothetical protein
MTTAAHRGAVEAVERPLNRGGDADDVLRAVVTTLVERMPHLERVWIVFAEGDQRVVGPSAGDPACEAQRAFPVRFQEAEIAYLTVAGLDAGDEATLARIATIIAPYCLVGWDTGGERWEP